MSTISMTKMTKMTKNMSNIFMLINQAILIIVDKHRTSYWTYKKDGYINTIVAKILKIVDMTPRYETGHVSPYRGDDVHYHCPMFCLDQIIIKN